MKLAPMSLLMLKLRQDIGINSLRWDDYLTGRLCHTNWVSVEHFWWLTGNMKNMGLTTVLYRCETFDAFELYDFADHQESMFEGKVDITPVLPDNVNELDAPYLVVRLI